MTSLAYEAESPRKGGLARVARGFAALASANVVGQIIGFVVLAVVARRVGPSNLGVYTFAQTFALWFTLPAVLGVGVLAVREIAREPGRTREVAGEVLGLEVWLFAICFAAMAVVSIWAAPDGHARTLILVVGFGSLCRAVDLTIVLQARQTLGPVALLVIAGQVVYGVLTPLFVVGGFSGVLTYAWLNQLGFVIASAGATIVVWRRFGAPRLQFKPWVLARRYRRGIMLGLPLLIGNVYLGVGTIMIGYMQPPRVVGLWGAAIKIPFSAFAVAALWTQAFYPHASKLAVEDPQRLRGQVARISSTFLVLTVPVAVGGTLLGSDMIGSIFGSRYAGAGTAFGLLMWWLVVEVLAVNYSDVLFAVGRERVVAAAVALGAFSSIALCAALIPPLGDSGAATALLVSAVAILVMQMLSFRRALGAVTPQLGRLMRGACATALMAAAILAIPGDVSVWVRIAAGSAVYVVAALALRAVTTSELLAIARRQA